MLPEKSILGRTAAARSYRPLYYTTVVITQCRGVKNRLPQKFGLLRLANSIMSSHSLGTYVLVVKANVSIPCTNIATRVIFRLKLLVEQRLKGLICLGMWPLSHSKTMSISYALGIR